MRSAAETSSPARIVLDHAPPKGKSRAGSSGDGIAELVTDAELVRERPEARQRAMQPDLANDWRHLHSECMSFVDLTELGVERRGNLNPDLANDRRHLHGECMRFVELAELGVQRCRARERAEPLEWLVPRLHVLERPELVAKCSVLIPAGEPECRTYFARQVL